ncbi:type VII secretion protein EccB [Rhodococcus sp. PvR044]|uniref:type VII secretion protein EccB n=1 Tax=Rhodococcus TaxID=1827 RepID=UPI000BDD3641|nr:MULTISPECIES: type VII secretion protein EccB [Rhodococcus]MBP1162808.1 type VII secretion protein EccB [Rhodococcus sp. PvR099]MCZ4554846.1 type VII secretion protein EccB [Rhodococcus maanshanensis]PTR44175.1 type VII secretion protein EccB [Rhodococcus sp. OK611]SNX89616.1 type VII secretion protein EccB [Rhodococcus sp. OK270]
MAAQPTTRWQVNGYRFLVRRMEHALVRRDVRMLHDPMRTQSRALTVGAVLAVIGLAGCGALALIRPQDKIGDAQIVVGKDSGAMFVMVEDTLHPVLNLASARLIAGDAATPVIVKESELGTRPRGALMGIPGAPSALPHGEPTAWTVCDSIASGGTKAIRTAVIAGDPELGENVSTLADGQALLVTGTDGTFLVYDGKRARIDPNNRAVSLAFGLDGVEPRPVSPGLLNAIPEAQAIAPPEISGAGEQPDYPVQGKTIGSVIRAKDAQGSKSYVVLRGGLQRISQATSDLIRASDSQGSAEADEVSLDVVSRPPQVNDLAVSTFPETAPEIVDIDSSPVSCLSWQPIEGADESDGGLNATVTVITGNALPLPRDAEMVSLAQADGTGPMVDTAYLKPGSGGLVQAAGMDPSSERKGALFFVADTGVRYGVENVDAAKVLGFTDGSVAAPWSIVGLLAPGPMLGREAAFLAHDGVAPDDQPVDVSPPSR